VTGFFGQFEYQMDEKGRVALPSVFRREARSDRFVLLQWEKPYLSLYPEEVWREKQSALLELRRSGEDEARYVRQLLSMATEVVPDKQGRILVPGLLQEAASLERAVFFLGNIDHVELWNPDRYRGEHGGALSEGAVGLAKRILG
jgi:MraZ protein